MQFSLDTTINSSSNLFHNCFALLVLVGQQRLVLVAVFVVSVRLLVDLVLQVGASLSHKKSA